MKSVAMLQSNYIPWKGVFDLIHRVDVFVFYDDVQYTKKDWRSRNYIPTKNGPLMLSVPVITKGKFDQLVCEAQIDPASDWQQKHLRTLELNYSKAPYFERYQPLLQDFYVDHQWENLSQMNVYMTKVIAKELGITTEFVYGPDLDCHGNKNGEKVIKICQKLGCDSFINGPASKAFMDESLFQEAGVQLSYMTYQYPKYKQRVYPFNHQVSVLDLLFNEGPNAPYYIWGWKEDPSVEADWIGQEPECT